MRLEGTFIQTVCRPAPMPLRACQVSLHRKGPCGNQDLDSSLMGICHLLALPNLSRSTHVIRRNQVLKKAADLPEVCDVMRWGGKKQRLEMIPPPNL